MDVDEVKANLDERIAEVYQDFYGNQTTTRDLKDKIKQKNLGFTNMY